ncbi:hypothetical protein [Nocardia nova]|uniref:hypothetical protein n=1 Tax=Nocardia nova TaxID=37330 RepID=UPI0027395A97|nr:hypothetical protein [Nocardia nova]
MARTLYLIDTRKPFGHYGRYPAPLALWLADRLKQWNRFLDTQDRASYLADMEWNAAHPESVARVAQCWRDGHYR